VTTTPAPTAQPEAVVPEVLHFTGRADLEATWIAHATEHVRSNGMAQWSPELRDLLRSITMTIAEVRP
jgi:hypothetical protein